MGNFGGIQVKFYNPDLTLASGVTVSEALNAESTLILNQVGEGSAEFLLPPGQSPTLSSIGMAVGNIVLAYQYDAILLSNRLVACFIIDRFPEKTTNSDGSITVNLTGPDLLKLLTYMKLYQDVGDTFDSTMDTAGAAGQDKINMGDYAPAGEITTVGTGESMQPGEDNCSVTDSSIFDVGAKVWIQLDNDSYHEVIVTEIKTAAETGFVNDHIYFAELAPSRAGVGNQVLLENFNKGDSVRIELDVGSTHDYFYSRIGSSIKVNEITLEHSLPTGDSWSIGNEIQITSNTTPTTQDLTQIMAQAIDRGWTVDLTGAGTPNNGTANGTNHKIDGASIMQTLIKTAEISGEFFRLIFDVATTPQKKIEWLATSDASGITLKQPTQSSVATDWANVNVGIIRSISEETQWDVLTEIAPYGGGNYSTIGEDSWSLNDATENDEGALAAHPGFSQYVEYGQWVIKNDAASLSDFHINEKVTFSDIEPKSATDAFKTDAADALQARAVEYLTARQDPTYFLRVDCVLHKDVYPGQSITVDADYGAPNWDIDNETWYIVEVRHSCTRGRYRETELLLSADSPVNRIDGALITADSILNGGSSSSTIVSGGGSSGSSSGGSTPSHEHADFLRKDGTIDLEGNLAVNAGITIDGVDISEHVIDVDAHHDLVTLAANSGMTITDQVISLGTPGTVSNSSTNSKSGVYHYHAVTTTSDADTNPSTILAGDSNGRIVVDRIGIRKQFPAYGLDMVDPNGAFRIVNTETDPGNKFGRMIVTNYDSSDGATFAFGATNISSANIAYFGGGSSTYNAATVLYFYAGATTTTKTGTLVMTMNTVGLGIGGHPGAYKLNVQGGNMALDGDLVLIGPQTIQTTSGNMTLQPTSDLYINALGGQVLLDATTDLQGQNWISGLYGAQFGIDTSTGFADFRAIQTEELHAWVFNAVETLVSSGDSVVTKYSSRLSRDFTIPAVDSSGTIYFKDSESVPDAATHPDGGWVQLEITNLGSTDFLIARVWGIVTNYTDLTGGDDGEHTYTFTTKYSVFSTSGLTALEGSAAIGWGEPGDPFIIISLNDLLGAPYIRTGYWTGANPYTAANRYITTQTGNLDGLAGLEGSGFFTGRSGGNQIAVTNYGGHFKGLPISMYAGTNENAQMRLYAFELNSDQSTAVAPNGDLSLSNISRDTGILDYYTYVNEDPDTEVVATGNYLYNTTGKNAEIVFDLEAINHTLTTLSITALIEFNGVSNDYLEMYAQVFKSDGTTALTDRMRITTSDHISTNDVVTIDFTNVDTTALDAEWDAARIKIEWVYEAAPVNEVIRMEPDSNYGPYIAVGTPTSMPTEFWTESTVGFWVGHDPLDGGMKMRIGGGSTDGTTPAMTFTTADGLKLWSASNKTTATIHFDTSGDAYISNILNIGVSGEIQQGTGTVGVDFDGLRIYRSSNIGTIGLYESDTRKVTMNDAGIGLLEGSTTDGKLRWTNAAGTDLCRIGFWESSGVNASWMSFYNIGTYSDKAFIFNGRIESSNSAVTAGTYVLAATHLYAEGGLVVGNDNTVTPSNGQLVLDQGGGDYAILSMESSDLTHSEGGKSSSNIYAEFKKSSNGNGGLQIRSYASDYSPFWLNAYAQTSTGGTPSTSSLAPIVFAAYVGDTSVGSTNNVAVFRSGTSTRWVLRGNGDVYIDGTQNTYDHMDDMKAVRAVSRTIGRTIRSKFDDLVRYNRADLEAAELISGTMVNTTNMMRLHSGAIWQMHEQALDQQSEIDRLKQELNELKGMISKWLSRQ